MRGSGRLMVTLLSVTCAGHAQSTGEIQVLSNDKYLLFRNVDAFSTRVRAIERDDTLPDHECMRRIFRAVELFALDDGSLIARPVREGSMVVAELDTHGKKSSPNMIRRAFPMAKKLVEEIQRDRDTDITLEVQLLLGSSIDEKALGLVEGATILRTESMTGFLRKAQEKGLQLRSLPPVATTVLKDIELECGIRGTAPDESGRGGKRALLLAGFSAFVEEDKLGIHLEAKTRDGKSADEPEWKLRVDLEKGQTAVRSLTWGKDRVLLLVRRAQ